MMPSRGLHIARGSAPRAFQLQCRNLSSASRNTPRATHLRTSTAGTALRTAQWQRYTPLAIPTIASIRHASTAPSPSPAQAAATPPPPGAETIPTSSIDTITLDNIDLSNAVDIASIPEKIGYLHEIGISYWYGPTSMLEWFMEHIHIYSGMPWWGSIAVTAIALRVLTFPFYLKASDVTARQSALVSVTKPIQDKMTAAQKSGDRETVMLAWQELMATRREAGISMTGQLTPVVMQGVIGFCGFKLIRAMAALPVPGLKDGGFAWLSDLTVPDPYGIMPIVMAGAIHVLIRLGGETGSMDANAISPGMRSMMLYGMPGIIMLIMTWQPGALCVWFAASGGIGMAQALTLQQPAVRRYFNLAPLYKPSKEEGRGTSPISALMESVMPSASAKAKRDRDSLRPAMDMGKNASYMQPQWQAPNLHTKAGSGNGSGRGKVIDVRGTSNASPGSSPPPSSGGVMGFASKFQARYKDFREQMSDKVAGRQERNEREAKKKAAEAYEQRARQREGKR